MPLKTQISSWNFIYLLTNWYSFFFVETYSQMVVSGRRKVAPIHFLVPELMNKWIYIDSAWHLHCTAYAERTTYRDQFPYAFARRRWAWLRCWRPHVSQCRNQMQSKLDLSRLKCFRKSISVPLRFTMCI